MKKKITAVALVVALLAVGIIGGTLAYFTDTDDATNTFTAGNVKIELIEQQRKVDNNGDKTTELEDFTQSKTLMPIVTANGSVQQDSKDVLLMSTSKNYVDKMITVKNTGNSDAFVRVYMAVPKALEDKQSEYGTFSDSVLHVNYYYNTKEDATDAEKTFTAYWDKEVRVGTVTIDEVVYNVYYRQYASTLAADATTGGRAYDGMYLDYRVDMDAQGNYTMDGVKIGFDLTKVEVPVAAVAVQAEGFANANAAFDAAFGAGYIPFN